MSSQYPNSGVLFTNTTKKHDKAPDMSGSIEIDVAYLEDLIAKSTTGEVTIKLGGWRRRDKNDNPMVSLKVDTFQPKPQQKKDEWDE